MTFDPCAPVEDDPVDVLVRLMQVDPAGTRAMIFADPDGLDPDELQLQQALWSAGPERRL